MSFRPKTTRDRKRLILRRTETAQDKEPLSRFLSLSFSPDTPKSQSPALFGVVSPTKNFGDHTTIESIKRNIPSHPPTHTRLSFHTQQEKLQDDVQFEKEGLP
jgi:hypothetical protein